MPCELYETCKLRLDVSLVYKNRFCYYENKGIEECNHKLALIEIEMLKDEVKRKNDFLDCIIKTLPEPMRVLP